MENLSNTLKAYMQREKLTVKGLAEALGVPYGTINTWLYVPDKRPAKKYRPMLRERFPGLFTGKGETKPGTTPQLPSPATPQLDDAETVQHVDRIRWILLLLHSELRWFIRAPSEARDQLREQLGTLSDLGFLGSALTMIGDEANFQRWRTLSNCRFLGFRKQQKKSRKETHRG